MFLITHGTEWPILCWCAVKQLLTHCVFGQHGINRFITAGLGGALCCKKHTAHTSIFIRHSLARLVVLMIILLWSSVTDFYAAAIVRRCWRRYVFMSSVSPSICPSVRPSGMLFSTDVNWFQKVKGQGPVWPRARRLEAYRARCCASSSNRLVVGCVFLMSQCKLCSMFISAYAWHYVLLNHHSRIVFLTIC